MEFINGVYGIYGFITVSILTFLGCMSEDDFRNLRVSWFFFVKLAYNKPSKLQKSTSFSDNVPPWQFDPYIDIYIFQFFGKMVTLLRMPEQQTAAKKRFGNWPAAYSQTFLPRVS